MMVVLLRKLVGFVTSYVQAGGEYITLLEPRRMKQLPRKVKTRHILNETATCGHIKLWPKYISFILFMRLESCLLILSSGKNMLEFQICFRRELQRLCLGAQRVFHTS
jgi:hypothetical protein